MFSLTNDLFKRRHYESLMNTTRLDKGIKKWLVQS